MLRNIAGFISGLIAGFIVVLAIEALNFVIIKPLPEGLDSSDPATMKAAIAKLPHVAFAMILLAWTAGAVVGPFTTAFISRGPRLVLACVTGGLFWLATLYNLLTIPGPWYLWLGLLIVPVATLAGAGLALRLRPSARAEAAQ